MIEPERLGAHKYGKLLTLTIEQMIQAIQDYAGNDYKVVARETKCFLNGDFKGEIYVWLYPRDQLELMETNEYLRIIK